jgi:hypothetical protein
MSRGDGSGFRKEFGTKGKKKAVNLLIGRFLLNL